MERIGVISQKSLDIKCYFCFTFLILFIYCAIVCLLIFLLDLFKQNLTDNILNLCCFSTILIHCLLQFILYSRNMWYFEAVLSIIIDNGRGREPCTGIEYESEHKLFI